MNDTPDMLPIEKLILGGLYHIEARNALVGIWSELDSPDPKYKYGFIIPRTKFKFTFLDHEYHWDTCDRHGTAKPLQFIEQSPSGMNDETMLQYLTQKELDHDRRGESIET